MTISGSHAYRGIDQGRKRQEVDRTAWAGSQLVFSSWDTIGVGTTLTEVISFGVAFEGQPFFSHGVELQEGEALAAADYPFVTAGVQEWVRTAQGQFDQAERFYTGARVWISVSSSKAYKLRHRFAFEGTVMRHREHIA